MQTLGVERPPGEVRDGWEGVRTEDEHQRPPTAQSWVGWVALRLANRYACACHTIECEVHKQRKPLHLRASLRMLALLPVPAKKEQRKRVSAGTLHFVPATNSLGAPHNVEIS